MAWLVVCLYNTRCGGLLAAAADVPCAMAAHALHGRVYPSPFLPCARSILYQRGVYPTEEFRPEPQYGVRLLLTKNEQLKKYLDTIIKQMSGERRERAGRGGATTTHLFSAAISAAARPGQARGKERGEGGVHPAHAAARIMCVGVDAWLWRP